MNILKDNVKKEEKNDNGKWGLGMLLLKVSRYILIIYLIWIFLEYKVIYIWIYFNIWWVYFLIKKDKNVRVILYN